MVPSPQHLSLDTEVFPLFLLRGDAFLAILTLLFKRENTLLSVGLMDLFPQRRTRQPLPPLSMIGIATTEIAFDGLDQIKWFRSAALL